MTTFYLGTHQPSWLGYVDIPLFVSHRRLAGRRTFPTARSSWALDSGGFSEIAMYGQWRTTPAEYATAVRRYRDEIGQLAWAAPMDWMCEPTMLDKTGLTVAEHQRRTVANYLLLRGLAPDLPIVPVLQGWAPDDYLACVDAYSDAGVDLTSEPTVGIGSVCRRQGTAQIAAIVSTLAAQGLRLHGFGVKTQGLREYAACLVSSDSMAWSARGRREPGCAPGHKTEANCLRFANAWRDRIQSILVGPVQLDLLAGAR